MINPALESELKRQENQNQDDFLNYILKPMSLHISAERRTKEPLKIEASIVLK
jgi:hypothetical protein